jgi:hypothetical protein
MQKKVNKSHILRLGFRKISLNGATPMEYIQANRNSVALSQVLDLCSISMTIDTSVVFG